MIDKLLDVLDKFTAILYVLLPAFVALFYEVKARFKNEKDKKILADHKKALEIYDIWEHEESKAVITKIKDQCNYYKDKSSADLVQYLQLENGTVATSKIQNMFLTCLAEDDRHGGVTKMIKLLQRLPYSETVCWLSKLTELNSYDKRFIYTPDLSKADYNRTTIDGVNGINSVIVAPVFTPDEILLGICVFYYSEKDYNGHFKKEDDWMLKFKTSIETIILDYHTHRDLKKEELGLKEV